MQDTVCDVLGPHVRPPANRPPPIHIEQPVGNALHIIMLLHRPKSQKRLNGLAFLRVVDLNSSR